MPTCSMEKSQIWTIASKLAISRFGRKSLEFLMWKLSWKGPQVWRTTVWVLRPNRSRSGTLIQGSLLWIQHTISFTILPETEIKIAKIILIILCYEKKEKFLIPFLYMMKIKPLLICGNRLTLIYLMNLSNYQKIIIMNSNPKKNDPDATLLANPGKLIQPFFKIKVL